MNIGVISIFNEPYKPVADITVAGLTKYCIRHGYNHHIFRFAPLLRDVVWERVPRILEVLPNYDWVVYFDSDVLVTNHNVKLEEFLDREVVLSESIRENGDLKLNDGVLFIKNKSEAKNILEMAWEMFGQDRIYCAQDALQKIYDAREDLRQFISVERQKRFNSFLYKEYGMPETTRGNWTPGDFALHLPGCSTARRVEIFSKTEVLQ